MNRLSRIAAPLVLGVVGVAILVVLGAWQVQRLAWKTDLIAEFEHRLADGPVAVPADPEPGRDRLLRVSASGTLGQRELHVLSSVKPWGAGYRVVTPLVLDDGRRVMADLGFVPERLKDPAAREAAIAGEDVALTGALYWPNETDSFTPEPDAGRNIWFARDVPALAGALDAEPLLIVAQSHDLGEWPSPRPPGADLPNRHLEYALTWFGLAVVWAIMSVIWLRARLREPPVLRPA